MTVLTISSTAPRSGCVTLPATSSNVPRSPSPTTLPRALSAAHTNELLMFLYIARGSAGEVRSMLIVGSRRPYLANFKPEISDLIKIAESCSRQLRAWADSLQNSDITGPRHLNDKSRAEYGKRQARVTGAAQFQQTLVQHLPLDHPMHPQNRREPDAPDNSRI